MTKENPIIFTEGSVKAILAGTKTQTRRLVLENGRTGKPVSTASVLWWRRGVEPGNEARWVGCDGLGGVGHIASPYGDAGDILWVKETWSPDHRWVYPCPDFAYKATAGITEWDIQEHVRGCRATEVGVFTKSADCLKCADFKWRSPLFMPRKAARLLLRIDAIDIERLHAITEEDAIAEGTKPAIDLMRVLATGDQTPSARAAYQAEWDTINRKRVLWAANPWVWKITFHDVTRTAHKSPGPTSPEPRSPT